MRLVVDTRFFLANNQTQDENYKKWAKSTLDSFENKTIIGFVPSIVIHEYYKILMQTLGKEVAEIRVSAILKSQLEVVELDASIAVEAAKLRCKYAELPTADAIIAATAIQTSSNYILTDDKHIKQIGETKTKWHQQT
jgi:predicted nucleic acid-binding protein